MSFFADINFFILLILILIPGIILGIIGKPLKYYRIIASIIVLYLVLNEEPKSGLYFLGFFIYELFLIKFYKYIRKKSRNKFIYRIFLILAILPLVCCKISEISHFSIFQFLGISYLTFRILQIIIEMYDGIIEEFRIIDYFDFLLCFSTFSSGPIDRSRRYLEDANKIIKRKDYLDLLGRGGIKIIIGVFYKFLVASIIFGYMGDNQAFTNIYSVIRYSYLYGFYLFFDFAGYSLMAVGTSYILGIKTPDNFNKPFISIDMKDFWNRWHMSLSFWFRDFVFSRIMMNFIRKKYFKTKLIGASIAFIINMTIMGLWHGIISSYILYGIYHGILLAITEIYQKKSKFYKKHKKQLWYKFVSFAITINLVMFGFLIFSGKLIEILK